MRFFFRDVGDLCRADPINCGVDGLGDNGCG